MQLHTPSAYPRDDGDFAVHVNAAADSIPFAIISLDAESRLELCPQSLADCDRLIRAAADARAKLEAVLSGLRHAYEEDGDRRCRRCGTYQGHAIHALPHAAEAQPPAVPDARTSMAADILDAAIRGGAPVTVAEDLPDCAGCGHLEAGHRRGKGAPVANGACLHARCGCGAYALPQDEAPGEADGWGTAEADSAQAIDAQERAGLRAAR